MVLVEEDSLFANLGLIPADCESLVLNDSALEKAARLRFFWTIMFGPFAGILNFCALSHLASGTVPAFLSQATRYWSHDLEADGGRLFPLALLYPCSYSFLFSNEKAWDIEYKGDTDELFVKALHIMNTSKMIDEAAKCIFTPI